MPYKNLQKRKQFNKKYRQENKERIKKQGIIYYLKNKERIKKKRQNYYLKIGKYKRKIWQECIQCRKGIFGVKKKKYCDDCRKKRMREMMKGNQYWRLVKNRPRGKDSPVWKGGITFWKKKIWDSPKYKEWRLKVFQRDNYICQRCGAKNGKGKTIYLEAHHIKGFTKLLRKHNINCREEADKCDELWKVELGQTLCRKCHQPTKNGRPKKRKT